MYLGLPPTPQESAQCHISVILSSDNCISQKPPVDGISSTVQNQIHPVSQNPKRFFFLVCHDEIKRNTSA